MSVFNRFLEGDETAFKEIFDMHYHGLVFYARTVIEETDVAEDIVQDQFVNLWQKRDRIKDPHKIKSYLYKSVLNSCLNYKKHLAVIHHHQELLPVKKESGHEMLNIEKLEFQSFLYNQINDLPVQCKKIFKLSRFFGLKHKEIAQSLGISENTVKNQIVKALQILHKQIFQKK